MHNAESPREDNTWLEVIHHELADRYRYSKIHGGKKYEHSKKQCQGGYNFGMTVKQVWESTKSETAVAAVAGVLYDITKWHAAGSIAWELRRFVRRATTEQTIEYAQLLQQVVRRDGRRLRKEPAFIGMDDVFWNGDLGEEIDRFKKVHFQ
ncbi:hypothetical protein KKE03_04650 [Patescibacteria group bacterium]|nr:hypothetical protein [Patescibacteria group bacterium]